MRRTSLPILFLTLPVLALTAAGCKDDSSESASFGTISLSATPAMLEIAPGESGKVTLAVTGGSVPAAVDLSIDGLPLGVAGSFSPASTTTSSELTITVAPNVGPQTLPLTIRGNSGTYSGSIDVSVVIKAAPFALAVAPASLEVHQGTTAVTQVNVTRNGDFKGPVDVSLDGLPAGVTALPITIPEDATAGTLTFSVNDSAAPGVTTPVTVHGTSGPAAQETTLSLEVLGKPGGLDASFGENGKALGDLGAGSGMNIRHFARQSDGKIVVVGARDGNETSDDFAIVRWSEDASIDTTFGTGGVVQTDIGSDENSATNVAIQADGKIVVVGDSWMGGSRGFAVARYNANGQLDNSFDEDGIVTTLLSPSPSDQSYAEAVAIQADGKIVVAGYAGPAGNIQLAVVRYMATGSLDTTFNTTGIAAKTPTEDIVAVTLQADGKIVAVGTSSNEEGDSEIQIVRLTSDGALDTTFDTDGVATVHYGGYGTGRAVTVQPDGKIVVVGTATELNSSPRIGVVRFLPSGALDTTFGDGGKTAVGVSGDQGSAVALQPDGKILAGGSGVYTDPTLREFYVVRLDASGKLDRSFDEDGRFYAGFNGAYDEVRDLFVLPDGRILAAGDSSTPNNTAAFLRLWQ